MGHEIIFGSSAYSFHSRFEEGKGTNPGELIAAAHAGCFSMALAATLAAAGHPPAKIHTTAKVNFGPVPVGFAIARIELTTEGSLLCIKAAAFEKTATEAKENCPFSKALKAVEITLTARLRNGEPNAMLTMPELSQAMSSCELCHGRGALSPQSKYQRLRVVAAEPN